MNSLPGLFPIEHQTTLALKNKKPDYSNSSSNVIPHLFPVIHLTKLLKKKTVTHQQDNNILKYFKKPSHVLTS